MQSIHDKVIQALKQAEKHNSSIMVKPEVILWTDPDKQWQPIIESLQKSYKALCGLGSYQPEKLTGPAIWLKTVISGQLTDCDWDETLTPVI